MITKGPIRIEADYLIETAIDPMQAAEIMAGEQSSGTFRSVPAETPELKLRAAARSLSSGVSAGTDRNVPEDCSPAMISAACIGSIAVSMR